MVSRGIGIGKEATYGQDVVLTEFISGIDENMSYDNQIISDQEMGQRGMAKPMLGAFKADGGFKFFGEPENMGLLLLGLFGQVNTIAGGGGGEFIHTFTPADVAQYLTMGVITGFTAGQRTHPGYATKKAKFSLAPNEKLLVEIDGFAKTLEIDALASPSFSVLDPFVFHQGDAQIATVSNTDIQAMTIEIENVFKEDEFTIGSRLKRTATMQGIKVSGTMDILFDSLTELELFLGKLAQTAPLEGEPATKQQLDLNIDTLVTISTVDTYQFNIELKECLYKTEKAPVVKQDRLIQNIEFECYAPASGDQVTAVLQNAVASY